MTDSPPQQAGLSLTGMSCATCASTIESSRETVDGVDDVSVNFATERATVHHADGISHDQLIEAVETAGYGVRDELLVDSFTLSERIFAKIKQHLFCAFIYNTLASPVAFFGLLHPGIAVVAMFTASLSVITNSARLSNLEL